MITSHLWTMMIYWSDPDALCDIIKVISETEPDVVMHANMVYWQDKNRTVKPSSFDRTLVSGKKRKRGSGKSDKSWNA